MHEKLLERMHKAQKAHRREMDEIFAVDKMLEQFGLNPALDGAISVYMYTAQRWSDSKKDFIGADRYHITVKHPLAAKEALRPVLLDAVPHWEKKYYVQQTYTYGEPDNLIEQWEHRFDKVDDLVANVIAFHFVSPAEEGMNLPGSCAVETVTNVTERSERSHLAVVCKKEA